MANNSLIKNIPQGTNVQMSSVSWSYMDGFTNQPAQVCKIQAVKVKTQ